MEDFKEMFGVTDWDKEPKILDEFFRREAITCEYKEGIGYLKFEEEIEERRLAGERTLNRTRVNLEERAVAEYLLELALNHEPESEAMQKWIFAPRLAQKSIIDWSVRQQRPKIQVIFRE